MTTSEFKNEFDLTYNNTLAGAPGIDAYEVSVYLTSAQEELVKQFYEASRDMKGSFESRETNRRALSELVVDEKITTQTSSARGLVPDSKFFELSKEPMYVVLETVTVKSNGEIILVKPVTHDEFMLSYKNPFRKPNKNKAWRVDISKALSKTTVEIVSAFELSRYNVRYLKFPSPIIISDLTTDSDVGGMGLTINGKTTVATSLLNESVHRDIVNRAVELAVRDYRETALAARIQMNNRI
jgi:hypothetical protein